MCIAMIAIALFLVINTTMPEYTPYFFVVVALFPFFLPFMKKKELCCTIEK